MVHLISYTWDGFVQREKKSKVRQINFVTNKLANLSLSCLLNLIYFDQAIYLLSTFLNSKRGKDL